MAEEASLNDVYHRLGGIERSISMIAEEQIRAANKRGEMYASQEATRIEVGEVKGEIRALDKRVSAMEPGFDEYMRLRHQVDGAGKLGRGLWWLGGWIIAAASGLVAFLYWLTGWPKLPG